MWPFGLVSNGSCGAAALEIVVGWVDSVGVIPILYCRRESHRTKTRNLSVRLRGWGYLVTVVSERMEVLGIRRYVGVSSLKGDFDRRCRELRMEVRSKSPMIDSTLHNYYVVGDSWT